MKAFPEVKYVRPEGFGSHMMAIEGGMDLRDYFAAAALISIAAHGIDNEETTESIAELAYCLAEEMMERRKK